MWAENNIWHKGKQEDSSLIANFSKYAKLRTPVALSVSNVAEPLTNTLLWNKQTYFVLQLSKKIQIIKLI